MTITGMRRMSCACGRRYHVPAYAAKEKLLYQCGKALGKKAETAVAATNDGLQKTNQRGV